LLHGSNNEVSILTRELRSPKELYRLAQPNGRISGLNLKLSKLGQLWKCRQKAFNALDSITLKALGSAWWEM